MAIIQHTNSVVLVVLAFSTVLIALLLYWLVGRDDWLPQAPGRGRRSIREFFKFIAGPFPISVGLHVALLFFLIKEVSQSPLPEFITIRLENVDNGGGGGSRQDAPVPDLPSIATPDTAPQDVAMPAPVIASQTTNYTSNYVRAINRGTFGNGAGGGIGSGYGHAIGSGFGGFIGTLRQTGLDVVLIIDGTGSMSRVIEDVKTRMKQLVLAIHRLVPTARIGIVEFGGKGERISVQPFTLSGGQLQEFLSVIKAEGGGQWQEDTLGAIRAGTSQMQWRPSAKKVVILVGDTPPFDEDLAEVMNLIHGFREQDGTFNTVDVTIEEHERFVHDVLQENKMTPLPGFYLQTQQAYQEMAAVGGGEWRSLTRDSEINQQVLVLAFGKKWQSQVAVFGTGISSAQP